MSGHYPTLTLLRTVQTSTFLISPLLFSSLFEMFPNLLCHRTPPVRCWNQDMWISQVPDLSVHQLAVVSDPGSVLGHSNHPYVVPKTAVFPFMKRVDLLHLYTVSGLYSFTSVTACLLRSSRFTQSVTILHGKFCTALVVSL